MNNQVKLLIASTLIFYSCLEEITTPSFTGELNTTAEMILYFESNGDFINSNLAPPLVDAEEVHNNLNDYLIIDLRSKDDYLAGHIPNSVNKSLDSLFSFVVNNHDLSYTKIVLVSPNGQSSSYFASLLRIVGFNKIYSLRFGMASWHMDFADEWLQALDDEVKTKSWTNDDTPKPSFTQLPTISFPDPDITIENKVKIRVQNLIRAGFNENSEYTLRINPASGEFTICYGKELLYLARRTGEFADLGHPPGTISYLDSPLYHFRSTNYLQTLPSNKIISVYGYNGQLSASLVAYLRVLGYNARTHLFGGNKLFYPRMVDDPELIDFAFTQSEIKNFEYITGN